MSSSPTPGAVEAPLLAAPSTGRIKFPRSARELRGSQSARIASAAVGSHIPCSLSQEGAPYLPPSDGAWRQGALRMLARRRG